MNSRSSLSAHPSSPPVAPNLISVASGKGGVGKTFFSVTLAHTLAKDHGKVLLLDGDLGLANVDIQLGLAVEHDLAEVFSGQSELANAVTRYQDGGFDIVAGPSGTGSLAALPRDRIVNMRQKMYVLATRYDHAVLDLGAGIDPPVRILAALARTCLVITNDEPTALTDAYAFIKVMTASAPGTELQVVVNMAEEVRQGQRTYETLSRACENFLRIRPPLAGIIRRDRHVRESIRNQCSLLSRYPNSDAADDIAALARSLVAA